MTRHTILIAVTAFAISLFVASVYVEVAQRQTQLKLELAIVEQTQTLNTLSLLNSENRADEITESIVRDCSEESRLRYETLLNRLAGLNSVELIEIEQLFDACASFFAERNAIMVARLGREFEVYQQYVQLYRNIEPRDATDYPEEVWGDIVSQEVERGQLLREQVEIQGTIISELQNQPRNSDAIESALVRAQQVSRRVAELNQSIDEARSSLYAL